MSFTNALNTVTTVRTVSWKRSSVPEPAARILPPSSCAAPVRTIAADSTNIEATITSAGEPKPWNASVGVSTPWRAGLPSVVHSGSKSASNAISAVTSGRTR